MPCQGPSDEDMRTEAACRLVAQLILYLYDQKAIEIDEASYLLQLQKEAEYALGHTQNLDMNTRVLCSILRQMQEADIDRYVYDGRNPLARKLADWWEAHQEEDREREALERAALNLHKGDK